jgi:hypothetical protein
MLAAVVLVLAATLQAHTLQDDPLESRLERVAGGKPDAASEFLTRLRRGLGTSDRVAVCGMVAYPLRQQDGIVQDAADCVARYDDIFTIPVRRAIGRQQFADLFVNQSGVMAGIGELWFAGSCRTAPCDLDDIRITIVNSHPEDGLRPPRGRVLLSCVAAGQRVEVAADGNGGVDLRIWPSPRPAAGSPATEFHGTETVDAINGCQQRRWSFAGDASYVVSEVMCPSDAVVPPMGTAGRVTRRQAGEEQGLWCFE